jgi:NDP-sugar pyrophosphorylase family protein
MVKPTTNSGAAANEQHPSDNKSEQKLQAVLLADIFTSAFHPITLDPPPSSSFSTAPSTTNAGTIPSISAGGGSRPLVLCPLNNVPILLHSINYLQGNGVQELYIICSSRSGNPDSIENYIRHHATTATKTNSGGNTTTASSVSSIAWSAKLTITVLRFIDCTNPGE